MKKQDVNDTAVKMAEEYIKLIDEYSEYDTGLEEPDYYVLPKSILINTISNFARFYQEKRMEELWHTPDQKPEEHKILLVDIEYGGIRSASYYLGGFWMTNPASWEKEDPVLTVIAWAYLSDLTKTEYHLNACDKCMQMTNHVNGICQKCKTEEG